MASHQDFDPQRETESAHSSEAPDLQRRWSAPHQRETESAHSSEAPDLQRRRSAPHQRETESAHSSEAPDLQRRWSELDALNIHLNPSFDQSDPDQRMSNQDEHGAQGAPSDEASGLEASMSSQEEPDNDSTSRHRAQSGHRRTSSRPDVPVTQRSRGSVDGADPRRRPSLKAEDYDFLELYAFDVECIPRGRLCHRDRFRQIQRDGGLRARAAICYYTQKGQPLHHSCFATRQDAGESLLTPDMSTLTPVQRAATGGFRVAQVICDPNDWDETSPRTVAQNQIQRLLDTKGCTIHYAFEMRFILAKPSDNNRSHYSPVDNEYMWGDITKVAKYEPMMMKFMESLREMGVFCGTLHRTAGPSQFEFGLLFDKDIKGADMAARFRKEAIFFFENKGFLASFRSHSDIHVCEHFALPMHMDHYLQEVNGINMFNDGPMGISETACQWLAGISSHLPALMALYRPTENCYTQNSCCSEERTQPPTVYGKHDRKTYFRRKQDGGQTFLENRLPCGASNPYLVLAGTIAAGLHGITEEMKFDLESRPVMPKSLQEALDNLENDEYLKEQLGQDFVSVFIAKKNEDILKRPCAPCNKKRLFIIFGFSVCLLFCTVLFFMKVLWDPDFLKQLNLLDVYAVVSNFFLSFFFEMGRAGLGY